MAITFVFDLDGYADQTQRAVLDNKTYDFNFKYNSYGESWKVFISEPGSDPICSFKLTTNSLPLLSYQYNSEIPQGQLLAGGVIDFGVRVSQYNVGPNKDCYLWYFS